MDTQPQFTVLLKNADKLEHVVINAKNEKRAWKRALKLGEKREAEILDVAVKPQPQLHNVVDRHAFLPHKILERGHLYSSHPIKVLPASGQTFMYRKTADQLAMQQTLYRVRSRERRIQQTQALIEKNRLAEHKKMYDVVSVTLNGEELPNPVAVEQTPQ